MKRIVISVIFLSFYVFCDGDGLQREKRQLVFPPQSIMQLAFAVVTPAQVKNRLIATNMGIMFNINLPTNMSIWYPWRTDYRRRRDVSSSNQLFYNLLESVLSLNGVDGRACLQKSVCQMREEPLLTQDIPHQIMNIIFGFGQRHTGELWEPRHHNTTCDVTFPTCRFSPVDIFKEMITYIWSYSE